MKKTKEKLEFRYYDIPREDFLITRQGDGWKRIYGSDEEVLHFHDLMEIGICHAGKGELRLEHTVIPYREGMISVIPPNYPHTTYSMNGSENYWEYLFLDPAKILQVMYPEDILLQQKILERINRKIFLGPESEAPHLTAIIRRILEEMREQKDFYRECVRGLALALLTDVSRLQGVSALVTEAGKHQRSGFDQVRPALEYIRENYASQMKIAEIAAVCHMSESHFRRLFEESISMTPVEYLNQVRILKACDLIKNTGSSMEEIAEKVGFTTSSTFNRNFKRVTGTSPYQWKKQPDNSEGRLADFNILIEKGW